MYKRFGKTDIGSIAGVLIAVAIIVAIVAVVSLDPTGKKGSGLGKEYVYDIEELGKVDPALVKYELTGKIIAAGFSNSRGIVVDGDLIYAAGDESIRVLDLSGSVKKTIELDQPVYCLAVDDNKIYVGFKDHVEIYDIEGRQLAKWKSLGESARLTSIAVTKKDVFAADAGNRAVVRYDTEGNIINYIGKKDKDRNIPGFVIPSPYFDIAVGSDGLLRVVSPGRHRIEAYTFDGDLEFWWGRPSSKIDGFCGCCNPINFAMFGDDRFVTCEKGLIRVKVYDADGVFESVVAGPEQLVKGRSVFACTTPAECQSGGFDVAVSNDGKVFVLDTIDNNIKIFSRVKAN